MKNMLSKCPSYGIIILQRELKKNKNMVSNSEPSRGDTDKNLIVQTNH